MKAVSQHETLKFSSIQRIFLESVTVKSIYERIESCLESEDIKSVIERYKNATYDVIGVQSSDGSINNYIELKSLAHDKSINTLMKGVTIKDIVSDSTPLANLISLLKDRSYLFVNHGDKIDGIVTRADINKPLVRLYLFGLITLLEMRLNALIPRYYANDLWLDILHTKRSVPIKKLFNERVKLSEDLTVIECAQFADKKTVLMNTPEFLDNFEFSKSSLKKFMEQAEKLRNSLAHSNSSITSELSWDALVKCVYQLESFLSNPNS